MFTFGVLRIKKWVGCGHMTIAESETRGLSLGGRSRRDFDGEIVINLLGPF